MEQFSNIEFGSARFWVKAYDVPAIRQKSSFAEFLGSKICHFVDGEAENMFVANKSLF